ncbi:hypothetical protein [Noviherbaspirillum pedocola]|uniref:Uncharacterized protein n=1 Tax=Noviherbaspirillum pedocola TaxID=2801341 RepID=A0A934W4M2_9BURK|nr:hypothetical protein [Noviherbaspirillum pedocola]MBK4738686.1 hypothetical protein [Noviherbaspirillum pedocola]
MTRYSVNIFRMRSMMKIYGGESMDIAIIRQAAALVLIGIVGEAIAAPAPSQFRDCMDIQTDAERLACYDDLTRNSTRTVVEPARTTGIQAPAAGGDKPVVQEPGHDDHGSYLISHWELDPTQKRGTFNFRPHHGFVAQI